MEEIEVGGEVARYLERQLLEHGTTPERIVQAAVADSVRQLDPRITGLAAAAGMEHKNTGGLAGQNISASVGRDAEEMAADRAHLRTNQDRVVDAVVGAGLAQGAVVRGDKSAFKPDEVQRIAADLGAAMGRNDAGRPAPPSVRAAREAMAQNLARKEGIPIEEARSRVDFLEQMREHVEGMDGERLEGFAAARKNLGVEWTPDVTEAAQRSIAERLPKWPSENAGHAEDLHDEKMRRVPTFHISATMEKELAASDGWEVAEDYAYWPPFEEFGIVIDPEANVTSAFCVRDREQDRSAVVAAIAPWSVYVSSSIAPFAELQTADEVAAIEERLRAREAVGDAAVNDVKLSESTWVVILDGTLAWYPNRFIDENVDSYTKEVPLRGKPLGGWPITLLGFYDLQTRTIHAPLFHLDVDDYVRAAIEATVRRYVVMAINFVLLLNNKDTKRIPIRTGNEGMTRQQRRAALRAGGTVRDEWQVRVKPNTGVSGLVRQAAECENVERKLPGRHKVRAHTRTYKSGKVVQIEEFQKCIDRPWAHKQLQDRPHYDAWSLKEES